MIDLNAIVPDNYINVDDIAKWREQRNQMGICDYDVLDLDLYLLEILSEGLELFVQKVQGYPDRKFQSLKEYEDYIKKIMNDINEIRDTFQNTYITDNSLELKIKDVFNRLSYIFFSLWI